MRTVTISLLCLLGVTASAENITGAKQLVCAAGRAQVCVESGECFASTPWELAIPDFVVIDTGKKTISTTKTSGENRSTKFASVDNQDGVLALQGFEGGRAFSFMIHQQTGQLTAAIARDGYSVTVFGACTNKEL
jgi:hypothetical protein